MRIIIPEFQSKEKLFSYLRENKQIHIAAKKSEIKHCDGIFNMSCDFDCVKSHAEKAIVNKADIVKGIESMSEFPVKVAINATNILDSHMDCHMVGTFKKSTQEKKLRYLLQEHKMEFDHIIADSVNDGLKAYLQKMTWAELGYKQFQGESEVLIYEAMVKRARNEYMAEQYAANRVLNHSVGMLYVKLFLCMNSESKYDIEERDNWEKYAPLVINQEVLQQFGYFWAVTEAKEIEGSAVPLGSCPATPTITVGKSEPQNEPPDGTHKNALDYDKLSNLLLTNF